MRFRSNGGYVSMSALGRILLDPQAGEMQGGTIVNDDRSQNQGDRQEQRPQDRGDGERDSENEAGDSKDANPFADELKSMREMIDALKRENETFKTKLTSTEEQERAKKREQEQAELERLRKAGDFDKIEQRYQNDVKDANARADAVERERDALRDRFRSTVVDLELSKALSQHRLAEGWADHLIRLHRDEFEAVERGDKFEVQSKDARSVASKVKELLSRPEYKRILLAENGTRGAGSTQRQEPNRSESEANDGDRMTPEGINRMLFEGFSKQRNGSGTLGTPRSFTLDK